MLDESEFLRRTASARCRGVHQDHPYVLQVDGTEHRVDYEPAESTTGLFGGNSNWRGPIWFPVNYLIIEALQKFHHYFGDDFKVECPTGSGRMMTLGEVAAELSRRLTRIFLRDADGPPAGLRRHSRCSRTIRTGATSCCSTSTSTATTAPASAPATRPAGPAWSRSCCSRAGKEDEGAAGLKGPKPSLA